MKSFNMLFKISDKKSPLPFPPTSVSLFFFLMTPLTQGWKSPVLDPLTPKI